MAFMELDEYLKKIEECPMYLKPNTSESLMYGFEMWFPFLVKGDFNTIVEGLKQKGFKITSRDESYDKIYSYLLTNNEKETEININNCGRFDSNWSDFINELHFNIYGMIHAGTCFDYRINEHRPRKIENNLYFPFTQTIISLSKSLKEKNYKFAFPDSTLSEDRDPIIYEPLN